MPRWSDPAPCEEDEQLFECPNCGNRACTEAESVVCDCGTSMQNISTPSQE